MNKKLVMKDEDCEKLKGEIAFLEKEVELLNTNLKSSQTLDVILSQQRSPIEKSGLGYAGESSSNNDNASNIEDARNLEINVDAPSSSKGKEKNQDNDGRNSTPRRLADGVKNTKGNEYHQRIPRKKDSRVLQGTLHLPSTKVYFLDIAILVQTLGTWQKIVGHITKTNIMVPVNLLQAILQEEVMISYS